MKTYLKYSIFFLPILLAFTCTNNTKPFGANVNCTSILDVDYQTGTPFCGQKNSKQRFDVYIPDLATPNPKPLIIFIHGGGFIGGDKQQIYPFVKNQIKHVLDNGWAFATINYRFLDLTNDCQNETCGVRDKCFDDIARCLKFIKANATTYGIDKNRIGIIGVSAGASAAQWLAFDGFEKKYGTTNTHYGVPAVDNENTDFKALYSDVSQGSLDIREWGNPIFQGQCGTTNLNENSIIQILTDNKECYMHAMYGVGPNYPSAWPYAGINTYLDDIAFFQLIGSSIPPKPKVFVRNTNALNLLGNPSSNILNHHPLHAYTLKNALVVNGYTTCWEVPNICYNDKYNCMSGWLQFFNNNL